MSGKTNKKRNVILVISLFCLLIFFILPLIHYRLCTDNKLYQNTSVFINEISEMQKNTLVVMTDDNFEVIDSLASYMANNQKHIDSAEIADILTSIVNSSNGFCTICYADINGNSFSNKNEEVNVADRNYFKKAVSGEKSIDLIDENRFDNLPVLVLAVPVIKNDAVKGVIYGCIKPEIWADLLKTKVFNGKTSIYICDSAGKTIMEPSGQTLEYDKKSIFDFIDKTKITNSSSEKIRNDISDKNGGGFMFMYEGKTQISTYIPLEINDWFIFATVEYQAIMNEYDFINENTFILLISLIIIFIIFMIIILLSERSRIKVLKNSSEILRQSEEKYRLFDELTDSIMFEVDIEKDTVSFNHNYEKVFGHPPQLKHLSDCKYPNVYINEDDFDEYRKMFDLIFAGQKKGVTDLRIADAAGKYLWNRIEYVAICDKKDKPVKLVGKIYNIDKEKKQMKQLEKKAETDSLTHLANNENLRMSVDEFLSVVGKKGSHAALLMDMDNFKLVNDTYGHLIGDDVLKKFADTLRSHFRSSDIISRMGGDEFAVLAKNVNDKISFENKLEKFCMAVNSISFEGSDGFKISCSIGVAYTDGEATFEEIFKKADLALYEAKHKGKNGYSVYKQTE